MRLKQSVKLTDCIVFFFAMEMIFLFVNRLKYFNFGRYYIFAVIIVGLSLVYFFRERSLDAKNMYILFPILYSLFLVIILNKEYTTDYLFATILFCTHSFVLCQIKFDDVQKAKIEFIFIFSAVIMSLILLIQHGQPYLDSNETRQALYYSKEEFYDVNFTAIYFYLPACISLYRGIEKRKMSYFICYVILITAIFATGSRGTILPVLMVSFLILFKTKSPWLLVLLPIGIFALFAFLPEDIFSRVFATSYVGNNRTRVNSWVYGLKLVFNDILWGNGLRASKQAIISIFNTDKYTIHNTYIVWLSAMGIVGGTSFLFYMVWPVIKCIVKKKFTLFIIISGYLFTLLMIEGNYSYVSLIPLNVIYILWNSWGDISFKERRRK